MSTRVLVHRKGADKCELAPLDKLRTLLTDPDTLVWVDLSTADEEATRVLTEIFELHPLVIEDIFQGKDRPKVEDYGSYLYLIVHGMDRDAEHPEALGTLELDLIVAKRWVVTHQSKPMRSVASVFEEVQRNSRLMQKGGPFLAHAILDHMTDHYVPVMDRLDEEIDALERRIIDAPSQECLHQIFKLKRSLQKLRRVAVYQRDVLTRVSRGEFDSIPKSALPFFRDVLDHFVRVADLAESYREAVSAALEAYLSVQSNRMNEIMKVLTLISTIMLPLTFLAGVYGMNFKHMPELEWYWGYPAALGLMAAVAVGLYAYFRSRRWI